MPISTMILAHTKAPRATKKKPAKHTGPHDPHHHAKQTAALWAMQSVDILHFGVNIKEYGILALGAVVMAVLLYFGLGGAK